MTELATYSRSGPIATIVMDDGKANVMSLAMLNSLHAALPSSGRWDLRGLVQSFLRIVLPGYFLYRPERADGSLTRFHQEDAEDSGRGVETSDLLMSPGFSESMRNWMSHVGPRRRPPAPLWLIQFPRHQEV